MKARVTKVVFKIDNKYHKKCSLCKVTKPVKAFARRGKRWQSACRECRRNFHYMHRYGITRKQYDKMLKKQKGRCKICGNKPSRGPLHVDHNHESGRVRGLLCTSCNRILGWFEGRRVNILRYLGDEGIDGGDNE